MAKSLRKSAARGNLSARLSPSRRRAADADADADLSILNAPGLYFIATDAPSASDVIRMKVGMSTDLQVRLDGYLTYHPEGFAIYGLLHATRAHVRAVESYAHYLLYIGLGTNYHTYMRPTRSHGHTLEWFTAPRCVFRQVYYMCKYFARFSVRGTGGNAALTAPPSPLRLSHNSNARDDVDAFVEPVHYDGSSNTDRIKHTPARPAVLDLILNNTDVSDSLDDLQRQLEGTRLTHGTQQKQQADDGRDPATGDDCEHLLDRLYATVCDDD